MSGFVDGLKDCEAGDWCSLYPDMPYGRAWREREKREVPESTRQALITARNTKKKRSKKGRGQGK
jgi:hypothetical protein